MDELSGLLDGPRARGAFLLRTVMDPPWSVRIEDEAPLALMALRSGAAWVLPDGGPPRRLEVGDVAIMRGPAPYTVADDPSTPPQVWIGPDQRCSGPGGSDLGDSMGLGVRTWGNSAAGATVLLVGTYRMSSEVSRRLLGALPSAAVIAADTWDSSVLDLLDAEVDAADPGQDVVLDRLLDLVLVNALRAWLLHPSAEDPASPAARSDPVVSQALRLLHHRPEHPWTVAELAAQTGVSRAALARRFSTLVGEPPMAYLTGWRMALAVDMLRDPDTTLATVARRVGYGSPFALSTAFKRVRGVTPHQERRGVRAW